MKHLRSFLIQQGEGGSGKMYKEHQSDVKDSGCVIQALLGSQLLTIFVSMAKEDFENLKFNVSQFSALQD